MIGINPTPGRPNPMRPTVRLHAPVLQVRDVPAGASVGYNATWRAGRPSRVATIAMGYADASTAPCRMWGCAILTAGRCRW